MKIISILCICSLLCACGIENIDKPNLCCPSYYNKPGVTVEYVEATLDKCGQQKLISMYYGPPNAYMNQFFKMKFGWKIMVFSCLMVLLAKAALIICQIAIPFAKLVVLINNQPCLQRA